MNGLAAPTTLVVRSLNVLAGAKAPSPVTKVRMAFLLTKTFENLVPLMLTLKPISPAPLLVTALKSIMHVAGAVADGHCVFENSQASPPVLFDGGLLSRPKSMKVWPACASGATASSSIGSNARAPALARWNVIMEGSPLILCQGTILAAIEC